MSLCNLCLAYVPRRSRPTLGEMLITTFLNLADANKTVVPGEVRWNKSLITVLLNRTEAKKYFYVVHVESSLVTTRHVRGCYAEHIA